MLMSLKLTIIFIIFNMMSERVKNEFSFVGTTMQKNPKVSWISNTKPWKSWNQPEFHIS